jgi:hypothetical protein
MEKSPDKSFRTCYISAVAGLNLNPLLSLLESKHITTLDAFSVWSDLTFSSMEEKIAKSDFVIGVLANKLPNDTVYYELGLAIGQGKPVFLILQEGAIIPPFLKKEVSIASSLDNLDIVSVYVDKFIENFKKPKRGTAKLKSRTFNEDENSLAEKLQSIKVQPNRVQAGFAFENFVMNLFQSQGFAVVSRGQNDTGVDMVIWIDSLENSIGNPILVEVKIGRLSEPRLEETERRLVNCLTRTNSHLALLVYNDLDGRLFTSVQPNYSNVVRLDVNSLIKHAVRHDIDRLILEERNRRAHAGSFQ